MTPEETIETHNLYLFRQKKIDEILGGFDPNKEVREVWGAVAPSRRRPKFRVFYRHVDAVNSVKNSSDSSGAVYFLAGGSWVLHEVWVEGKELYR